MKTTLSRNYAVEEGERTRQRVRFCAPSRKTGGAGAANRLVMGASPPPTGEGASRKTRRRVSSPKETAWIRLRGWWLVVSLVLGLGGTQEAWGSGACT